MGSQDLNRIKANRALATSILDTYLALTDSFGVDLYGNLFVPVQGLQPRTFVADETGPDVVTFELDLTLETITFVFSEPVTSATLDPAQIFISGSLQSSQQQYSLNGGILDSVTDLSTRISFFLTTTFLNMIKADTNVCTSASNCFLFMGQGSISDVSSNPILATTVGITVGVFTADTIGPSLTSFDLDLNQGVMSMTYNEPLDTTSFAPSNILISGSTYDSGTAVPISDASINSSTNLNLQLRLDLGYTSLNSLRQVFATGGFTLTSSSASVTDTAGNGAIPITSTNPLRPTFVNSDITRPSVTRFTPGTATERRLTFTFDEYVNATSWDPTLMTITLSTSQGSNTYSSFTGGVIVSGTPDTLVYSFLAGEFTSTFATQYTNAYSDGSISITAPSGLVLDFNRNPLGAVSLIFTNDRTRPTLLSYVLDLNAGTLDLSFSEAVSIISVAGRVRIQNTPTNPSTTYDFVQNGTVQETTASTSIRLTLGTMDLNSIKLDSSLATSIQDTYLVLQDNFASDISGNLLTGTSQDGIPASSFVPDSTRPTLLRSDFDLNAGTLQLQFDEPMSATNDPSEIFLTGQATSSPTGYNLSDSLVLAGTDQSTVFTIFISRTPLNMIQSDTNVCTSISVCYVFLTMLSFSDVSGNALQPSASSIAVSSFIPDTTPPTLLSYDIDLNAGIMTLSFSDPIFIEAFSTFGLQIQSQTQATGTPVRLSGSGIDQVLDYNTVIVLRFSPMILNSLKVLARSGGLALTMETLTALDTAGNMVMQISSSAPLAPANFIRDTTPPTIVSFMPGYPYERQLTLGFDEFVDPATLNPSLMTLILTTSQGPMSYSAIQGVSTPSGIGLTLVISLPSSLFVPPFSDQYDEAYFEGKVNITANPGFISDLANNALSTTAMLSYRNSTLPSDTDPPFLRSYVLDLNMGTIMMTFSENVVIVTVAGQISFQNSPSAPTAVYNVMQNATDISSSLTEGTVILTLNNTDLNGLKINPSLATSVANTYMVLMSSFVRDTAGNFIEPDTRGQRPAMLIPDIQGPSVTSFDLDLDSNQLTLFFDEPVRVSTFDETRITLTNTSNLDATNRTSVQIMMVERLEFNEIVTSLRTVFRVNDSINVKSAQLCYDRSNCFALFDARLISDVNLNPSPAATTTALQVSDLRQDVTPPRLQSFSTFDLDSGVFVLIFTEPVNASSTDYTDIEFLNTAMNPTINVTLSEGFTSPDHIEIDFSFNRKDLNFIKDTPGLCTSRDNCFISLPSFFITDIGMNPFLHQNYAPQAVAGIHQPNLFIPDTTAPVLESYTVDMNSGNIEITFSEVIQMSTFSPDKLTLFNATNGALNLTLSAQSQFTFENFDDAVSVSFTERDFTLLKAQNLCSSLDDTFLGIASQMPILDTSNNQFVNITRENAIQATVFIPDTTRPMLLSFDLFNIDNGSFIITFDEPIELSSVRLELITFLAQVNSQVNFTLTGGVAEYINEFKRSILVTFDSNDRVQIKLVSGLAVDFASTYISLGDGMCNDRNGNPLLAIPPNQAVALSGQYVHDQSEASLQSFNLDMNTGQMMLIFNDVIDAASVDATSLTIQNSRMQSDSSYTLTSTSGVISTSSNVITIAIRNPDLNAIKLDLNLATESSNTFINFPSTFATSFEGNAVIGILVENSVPARNYVSDSTGPQLGAFTLDMNLGLLSLTFSEPVLVSTTDAELLIFKRSVTATNGDVELNNGGVVNTTDVSSLTLDIIIENNDLNTLKSSRILATRFDNTFLTVVPSFIQDVSGNQIQADTVQSSGFIPDTTPPELVFFNANLTDTGKLMLQFSEAVVVRNGAATSLSLTNSTTNPFTTLPLTAARIVEPFLGVVEINIDSSLLNRLLIDMTIASSTKNLFITIGSGGITDWSDNAIEPITVAEGQRVQYIYRSCFDPSTYNNISLGTCEPCPDACNGGCTGNSLTVGEGGCRRCFIATFDRLNNLDYCIPQSSDCPNGYYDDTASSPDLTQLADTVCKPCHEHCTTCTGPQSINCQSCNSAIMLSPDNGALTSCLESCDNLPDPSLCQTCHPYCNGCFGPTNRDCVACNESSLPDVSPLTCVPGCESGQYLQTIAQGMYECRPCHSLCIECTGPTASDCKSCTVANVTDESGQSTCAQACPDVVNMFIDNSSSLLCTPCDEQCSGGCSGPRNTDCNDCKESMIMNSLGVECVPATSEGISTTLIVIIACSVGGGLILILFLFVAICICFCCVYRRKGNLPIERVTLVEEKVTSEPVMTATTSKF